MKEDTLERLLRQRPLIEAPAGMKESIMSQLPQKTSVKSSRSNVLPEKIMLALSLITAILVVSLTIDLSVFADGLWAATASLIALFSKNSFYVNQMATFANKLPVYLMLITFAIVLVLSLEKLVLSKLRSKIHLF